MRDPNIKAIQTRYAGHYFRSRLEARWAVFLDHCGVKWEYEKEGYDLSDRSEEIGDFVLGGYLPDFWLPGYKAWLEIKGGLPDIHWSLTLPEIQVWNLVAITGADYGWVFFGLPDINTPCSMIYHPHSDVCPYPDRPSRNDGGIVDMLSRVNLSDDHFEIAKSARFEFGARPK